MHPHCAGLDVHKKLVVACVLHMADGKVTTRVKTFPATTQELMALSDWLSAQGCTHIAMEAAGVYWKPVWHILSDGEFELTLANAAHVKNVPGRKTDVNDAMWLADLMAHGLIRASFVPGEPTQQMRDLLRTRKQFARAQHSYATHPEEAGERRHQARFGHHRYRRPLRPPHDRGLDRRPDRSPGSGRTAPRAYPCHQARRNWGRRCAGG